MDSPDPPRIRNPSKYCRYSPELYTGEYEEVYKRRSWSWTMGVGLSFQVAKIARRSCLRRCGPYFNRLCQTMDPAKRDRIWRCKNYHDEKWHRQVFPLYICAVTQGCDYKRFFCGDCLFSREDIEDMQDHIFDLHIRYADIVLPLPRDNPLATTYYEDLAPSQIGDLNVRVTYLKSMREYNASLMDLGMYHIYLLTNSNQTYCCPFCDFMNRDRNLIIKHARNHIVFLMMISKLNGSNEITCNVLRKVRRDRDGHPGYLPFIEHSENEEEFMTDVLENESVFYNPRYDDEAKGDYNLLEFPFVQRGQKRDLLDNPTLMLGKPDQTSFLSVGHPLRYADESKFPDLLNGGDLTLPLGDLCQTSSEAKVQAATTSCAMSTPDVVAKVHNEEYQILCEWIGEEEEVEEEIVDPDERWVDVVALQRGEGDPEQEEREEIERIQSAEEAEREAREKEEAVDHISSRVEVIIEGNALSKVGTTGDMDVELKKGERVKVHIYLTKH